MSKQDMLKVQTCVLRVPIHCEGCKHKVKKKLQKVKGVNKVNIDSEQGRVTVSGSADPACLLEKAGKHAQLWGPPKGHPVLMEKPQHKNGNGFVQIPHKKEEKHPGKDHKSVRFNLPEEDDEEDDDFGDDDTEDDDLFDDEFEPHKPAGKAVAAKNSHHKGSKGAIDVFLKSMLKKAGRKNGDSDKKSKKGGEDKKGDNGKNNNGSKKGGFELGDLKKGKDDFDSFTKKDFDGGKQQHQQQQQQQHKGFTKMKVNHGEGGGRNMDMMGKKEAFPAMNDGRFMGAGPGNNPYSQQQQQMAHMMMMSRQQRENGHGAYHPAAYAIPPPPAMVYGPSPPPVMSYGPPPPAATEQYAHMFSDENTDSCSIM